MFILCLALCAQLSFLLLKESEERMEIKSQRSAVLFSTVQFKCETASFYAPAAFLGLGHWICAHLPPTNCVFSQFHWWSSLNSLMQRLQTQEQKAAAPNSTSRRVSSAVFISMHQLWETTSCLLLDHFGVEFPHLQCRLCVISLPLSLSFADIHSLSASCGAAVDVSIIVPMVRHCAWLFWPWITLKLDTFLWPITKQFDLEWLCYTEAYIFMLISIRPSPLLSTCWTLCVLNVQDNFSMWDHCECLNQL